MRVLVTGSNGFIGSHVCDYLHKQNIYVIGLGRQPEPVSYVDKYIRGDIDEDEIFTKLGNSVLGKVDAIIHLAADMRKEPYNVEVVQHNCTGTQRLLEICEKDKIDTFLQLSSLPVIGHPIIVPITESHPLLPPTVYHATKIMEELLADYAYRKHNIRTASFRISAPVGPRMNKETIFSVFIQNALKNDPIILSGTGERKQTYIHAEDIAQALYLSLSNDNIAGIYNLSSYNHISNYDLANKIVKLLDSKSTISFSGLDDRENNFDWNVSIEKLTSTISFQPKINIDEAIIDYAKWIKNQE